MKRKFSKRIYGWHDTKKVAYEIRATPEHIQVTQILLWYHYRKTEWVMHSLEPQTMDFGVLKIKLISDSNGFWWLENPIIKESLIHTGMKNLTEHQDKYRIILLTPIEALAINNILQKGDK